MNAIVFLIKMLVECKYEKIELTTPPIIVCNDNHWVFEEFEVIDTI